MSETTTSTTPSAAPVAPEQPKPEAPKPTAPEAAPTRDADEAPLGEPGLKALREERAAREKLEKAMQDQRTALLAAFGVEQEKAGDDIVTTLQQQVAEMRQESLVDRVARRHGITDDTDVELLRSARDEGHMARLAERLKVSNAGPNVPAPDPSQASAPLSEAAAADVAYQGFFPDSSK